MGRKISQKSARMAKPTNPRTANARKARKRNVIILAAHYGAGSGSVPGTARATVSADFSGARRRLGLCHIVEDETAADFLHRDALGLVRRRFMRVVLFVIAAEADDRPTAQLLRAHRGNVHVEETTLDWSRFRAQPWLIVGFGRGFVERLVLGHRSRPD